MASGAGAYLPGFCRSRAQKAYDGHMPTDTEREAPMTNTASSRSEIIRDIRNSDKTYFVRNLTNERISSSLSEPPLSLGPKGHGEDVAILPKAVLDEPGFQRMWSAGKLAVSDDPEIESEMIESAGIAQARQDEEYRRLTGEVEIEEPYSNKELVEKTCLISGERVYQSQADIKNMVPPLAPEHKNRAHEFTPHVSQDEKGNEVVTFSRVTIEK